MIWQRYRDRDNPLRVVSAVYYSMEDCEEAEEEELLALLDKCREQGERKMPAAGWVVQTVGGDLSLLSIYDFDRYVLLSPEEEVAWEKERDQITDMSEEELDAELLHLGIDPDALSERAEAFVAGLRREGLLPQVRKKREP